MLNKPFVSVSIETMELQKEYWKTKNIFKEFYIFLFNRLLGAIFGKPYRKYRNYKIKPIPMPSRDYPL
jgi:hypothetical protein